MGVKLDGLVVFSTPKVGMVRGLMGGLEVLKPKGKTCLNLDQC